jgi:hypothetical protein
MGWVDPEHIPTLEQDWRYGRLINLTRRLLEAQPPQPSVSPSALPDTGHRNRHAGSVSDEPCPACQGSGLTEHTEHTVETDKDGNQVPVERHWTGPCNTCHGSRKA